MATARLFLFVGSPGAGKTSIANVIAIAAGATHLCADVERHKLYDKPTHSVAESTELYNKLNDAAGYLLEHGKSVVFDTNFNFYEDRQKLRTIADHYGATTLIIWVTTPNALSKKRAVAAETTRNGYDINMTAEQFDAIVAKLEPPRKDENFIKIDGTNIDEEAVTRLITG